MPKKKNPRKPSNAAYVAQTESTSSALKKRMVKWASISVILAILLSLLIASISASPSQAAESTPLAACAGVDTNGDGKFDSADYDSQPVCNDTGSQDVTGQNKVMPTPCVIPDTDGDAITNDVDPDIDGDEIVNGLDDDIDGDNILNSNDGDPADTNCNDNAAPPMLPGTAGDGSAGNEIRWFAVLAILTLGLGYIVLRRIRGAKK